MGGAAFNKHSPPLPTPRMPKSVYLQVLSQSLEILRTNFENADAAIEAPGKPDFGDVDILVAGPKTAAFDESLTAKREVAANLQEALKARASVHGKGDPTINLAIPWPIVDLEEKFVQLDVHICSSPETITWLLFKQAHGDLWNILGTHIRPFGLIVNETGMYLRIPEIELLDRKKSMVFLTSDASQVLEFLGMEVEPWWKEFESQQAMFEYAATCKMFYVKEKIEPDVAEGDVVGIIAGQEGGEEGKKKLKHNDRARMGKRPIFRAWIEEFIPACRAAGKHSVASFGITREMVRDQAFEKFGVRDEYEARRKEWNLARHWDLVWRQCIKESIPIEGVDPAFRAAAIRQLKAVIMEGEDFDGHPQRPMELEKDENGYYDVDAVRRWVVANWKRAGEINWAITLEKGRERMKVKAEKTRK